MRPNKLINEKSPYLIQHAYNPVDWYPWGEEAFNKARAENKPIFLSVGYSTCYWCHVMEREVFENQDIAQMMNESFINIKVDREERPDIDRIYMSALQSMTGSGGWPMNLFLTPELKPFYGATYIPPKAKYGRNGIEDIINEINKLWKSRQEEVIDSSNKIFGFLVKKTNKKTNVIFDDDSIIELQNKTFQQADNSFDVENGGFGQGNKFPRPVLLDFLLKYYHRFNEIEALDIVTFTLKKMYKGGIFDHLGGGFHRYSVDTYWRVPHFEKMLYDQAQIAELYLDTYLITKKELFLNSAENTLNYVLRNLTDNEGGFYSAEDAESYISEDDTSEKQEGAYYLWEKNEINELLNPEETKIFNTYFGLEQSGNTILDPHNVFGNRNVLYISKEIEEIAKSINISFDVVNKIIEDSKLKLLEIREKRPKPHLDDKILTSWNGLMISAMSKAYKVTAEKKYLDSAIKCADFLLQKLFSREEKILFHRFRNNEVKYNGTLEDYAFLINGLINLYEASLNIKYLKCAIELNDITCEKFYDDEKSGFYDTEPDKKDVIINLKDSYDGAEPSGNSVQLINMLKIGLITQNGSLIEQAKISLEFFFDEVSRLPFATPVMINAYFYYVNSFQEFIISGIDNNISSNFIKEINNHYLPDKILLAGDSELSKISNFINNISKDDEKPAVYICENYKCNLPIFDIENLKKYLESKKENLKEINK